MKKVRFESPLKSRRLRMSDSECHSPRPFLDNQFRSSPPDIGNYERILPFSSDPVQRFENSNSSPYPTVSKTSTNVVSFTQKEQFWKPSNDLDLSLLDTSFHEPRQPICKESLNATKDRWLLSQHSNTTNITNTCSTNGNEPQVLKPLDNVNPPNILVKDNSFFIRRDNIDKFHTNVRPINPLQNQLTKLTIGKENRTVAGPEDHFREHLPHSTVHKLPEQNRPVAQNSHDCACHQCTKIPQKLPNTVVEQTHACCKQQLNHGGCIHQSQPQPICSHCDHVPAPNQHSLCHYKPQLPQNAVDKKTWILEKYQQNPNCTELQKQTNISKEKREPTVADLFKIIKLQNEQLQLLQEKVDKFITQQNPQPKLTCTHENVTMNTGNEQVKMSIGVMTSFEMVHTSTVINKEVVKQTDNEIQCSKSQISIKEVVSKPINMNFLDGITPVNGEQSNNVQEQREPDEKTLNEVSLYNVQVDNATTPLMSPDQTLYLDVRDYSESETESIDQSHVGWTYYNKVMTHVNGMLQDSEMPSSASAMFRNMRQHCVQMHIDKTNVSVTKRVKFGDDPLGIQQPHIYQPSTDTSLKMKQLASKYLKTVTPVQKPPLPIAPSTNIDMSFATRNYMEKHKLLQGQPSSSKSPQLNDIPRFLDITALKRQPKFL